MTALVSFDSRERATGTVAYPDRYRELHALLASPEPMAVQGAGLSYCLASGGAGVRTISSRHLNRFLAYDPEHRHLRVESGVTIGDVLSFAVAHGCYFPVLPGHPAITVGGCAGFNVHGKTQHNVGNFSDHVVSLTLVHPDHGELTCSPTENPEVFELTLGGMGLTGYITTLTLALQPLAGRSVRRVAHPVADVLEAVDFMESRRDSGEALYAWNDLNRVGDRFGRGLVYVEEFHDREVPSKVRYRQLAPKKRRGIPFTAARIPTEAMNVAYRAREKLHRPSPRSVEDAAFPINGSEVYYRLFGRRGFREYQVLLPTATWRTAIAEIQRLLQGAKVPVTLGSVKLFSGEPHLLWFRGEGVCLAIDAADGKRTRRLFRELDRVAIEHGAPVNPAKDSRLGAETVRAVFPGYEEFRERLHAFDPLRRFDSELRRRLDV